MEQSLVNLAIADGVSFVCAMCKKYWAARDLKIEGHRCTVEEGTCGGPLFGMGFPKYEGPITDLKMWCFACGHGSKFGVGVSGKLIGVCKKHAIWLNEQAEKNGILVKTTIGGDATKELFPRVKKTLAETIAEEEVKMQSGK